MKKTASKTAKNGPSKVIQMPKNKKAGNRPRPSGKAKAGKRGSGYMTVVIVALVTVIVGIILITYLTPGKLTAPDKTGFRDINIYVSDKEGVELKARKVSIRAGTPAEEARGAVTALLENNETLPFGARLIGLSVKDSTAYADFSAELAANHQGGSSGEIQTIYSIVNTIALNIPEIKRVQILIEGRSEKTLAGHIDISQPLSPDSITSKN